MFQVSYLYAKNCPQDIIPEAKYDYVLFVPPSPNNDDTTESSSSNQVTWFFVPDGKSTIDSMDENVLLQAAAAFGGSNNNSNRKNLPDSVEGPMTTGAMLTLLDGRSSSDDEAISSSLSRRRYYDLMVPHCFCYQGMTLYRQLFEDMLQIPHPGPTWICNAIAQNKALTRNVLEGCPGVHIPKGEVLLFSQGQPQQQGSAALMPMPSLPLPFVVKPACEDNSRGVSLVRTPEEIRPALTKAFAFGPQVVVEEFVPGREVRAGCVETDDGGVRVFSCKIEYLMRDKDCPIRREEDKLTTSTPTTTTNTHLVQTKCEREFLTPDMKLATSSNVPPLAPTTVAMMDEAVRSAHAALQSRDYTLLDFRVHEQTGVPYVIEACPFWTFTPISVISLMADRSVEFFPRKASIDEEEKKDEVDVVEEPEPLWSGTFRSVARAMWERTAQR